MVFEVVATTGEAAFSTPSSSCCFRFMFLRLNLLAVVAVNLTWEKLVLVWLTKF